MSASVDPQEDARIEAEVIEFLSKERYKKHLAYWQLGDLIFEQNPYYNEEAVQLDLKNPDKVKMAGRLAENNAEPGHTFFDQHPGEVIPKPPDADNPGPNDPPVTYYFQLGVNTREYDVDKPKRRNVVKELEIEYGPSILEEGKDKAPHLIILYAGGNN